MDATLLILRKYVEQLVMKIEAELMSRPVLLGNSQHSVYIEIRYGLRSF